MDCNGDLEPLSEGDRGKTEDSTALDGDERKSEKTTARGGDEIKSEETTTQVDLHEVEEKTFVDAMASGDERKVEETTTSVDEDKTEGAAVPVKEKKTKATATPGDEGVTEGATASGENGKTEGTTASEENEVKAECTTSSGDDVKIVTLVSQRNGEDSGVITRNPRDYPCTNCDSGAPSSHYCPKCDVYFCKPCLWQLCDHGALGKMSIAKWGQPVPQLEETCDFHNGQLLQLYCKNHDVVACCPCFRHGEHRPCEAEYIPEVAKMTDETVHIPKLKRDLKRIAKTMKTMKTVQSQRHATLKKSHNKTNTMIKTFRKKINGMLDKLEKQSEEDVRYFQSCEHNKIKLNIDMLSHMEQFLNKYTEKIETIGRNKSQIFTRVKRCQEWVRDTDKTLNDLNIKWGSDKIEYNLNNKIEQFLAELKSLGNLVYPESQYIVKKMKEYPIKLDKDENKCNITSICQLTDDKFVMADNDNNSLKLLDASFKIIDDYQLENWPWGVCKLDDDKVAVALGGKRIDFVDVDKDGMRHRDSFRLSHSCFGVAYHDDKLYVTDQCRSLYMYTVDEWTMQPDSVVKLGTNVLSQPRNLCLSQDNKTLFVTDIDKGLVTLDLEGNVLATIKPRDIKSAFGVALSRIADPLVAGQDSDNVVQVFRTGERRIREVVPQSKGLTKPQGVCVDTRENKLLVGGACNLLRVFDIVLEG